MYATRTVSVKLKIMIKINVLELSALFVAAIGLSYIRKYPSLEIYHIRYLELLFLVGGFRGYISLVCEDVVAPRIKIA